MKNTVKLTTISALVMLSAHAMAEDATQDFTWTGTVPAADATGGIKIKDLSSGATFDAGTFTLTKTAEHPSPSYGYFDITSASTLSFDVVTDDASEDHVDYYYTMTSFMYQFEAGGTMNNIHTTTQQTVGLVADNTPLQLDARTTTAATAPTDLTLTGYGSFIYGNEHSYHVTMLITDQAI